MSRLGGWVRWIGCAAVWEAGRAVCGERHLRQTQAYSPTATEDDGVGRGDIHTYAIKTCSQLTPDNSRQTNRAGELVFLQ